MRTLRASVGSSLPLGGGTVSLAKPGQAVGKERAVVWGRCGRAEGPMGSFQVDLPSHLGLLPFPYPEDTLPLPLRQEPWGVSPQLLPMPRLP